MTRIREERTAIGKPTHEAAQQAENGQGIHLLHHTIHLVVKPPAAAELYLSGLTTLEITEHGGNDFVGTRIQCIQYGSCKFALHVQFVEEL